MPGLPDDDSLVHFLEGEINDALSQGIVIWVSSLLFCLRGLRFLILLALTDDIKNVVGLAIVLFQILAIGRTVIIELQLRGKRVVKNLSGDLSAFLGLWLIVKDSWGLDVKLAAKEIHLQFRLLINLFSNYSIVSIKGPITTCVTRSKKNSLDTPSAADKTAASFLLVFSPQDFSQRTRLACSEFFIHSMAFETLGC